jgi:hypothetical protein
LRGAVLSLGMCFRLLRHCCFVRPGTSTAISFQFLAPCVCTPVRLHCILQRDVFFCCAATLVASHSADVGTQDIVPSVTGNRDPTLAIVRLYRILQLAVFDCCPFASSRSADGWIQVIRPSVLTLTIRWMRNQRCNCTPIFATVRLYCILRHAVFVFFPFTPTSSRLVDAGIQDIAPSIPTLLFVRPGTRAATTTKYLSP